jgi:hypothetical protein
MVAKGKAWYMMVAKRESLLKLLPGKKKINKKK